MVVQRCLQFYITHALLLVSAKSFSFTDSRCHSPKGHQIFRQTASRPQFAKESSTEDDAHEAVLQKNRLMIFGLGNVGALVAQKSTSLISNINSQDTTPFFDHVYGTSRRGKEIEGVQVIDFDAHQELEDIIPSCTHILVTIPPVDPSSNSDSNNENSTIVGGRSRKGEYFCDPVLNHPTFSLQDLVPANTWVGYISSTSVYGNHDGEWVTEDSEVKCKPGTKGELYFRAENEWRSTAHQCGWRSHVFRASGLYGNTRSAIHTIRKRGVPAMVDKGNATAQGKGKGVFPTSRIHEEDVSRAILSAAMYDESEAGHCLWNLADDNPAPRTDVMAFGTKLLEEANLHPQMKLKSKSPSTIPQQSERERRRSSDRKRVNNQQMKDLLLPDGKLVYPTYREGLQSVLIHNKNEWSSDAASE